MERVSAQRTIFQFRYGDLILAIAKRDDAARFDAASFSLLLVLIILVPRFAFRVSAA